MLLLGLPPTPALAPWVMGYWFIEDLEGVYAGQPIRTTPHSSLFTRRGFSAWRKPSWV
jgi:hypothetical protein